MIDTVQGFVSHTASLVDTIPVIDGIAAINILKKGWSHHVKESSLTFRVESPELEILPSVSTA